MADSRLFIIESSKVREPASRVGGGMVKVTVLLLIVEKVMWDDWTVTRSGFKPGPHSWGQPFLHSAIPLEENSPN